MRLVLSQGHGRGTPGFSGFPNAFALPYALVITAYSFDLAAKLLAAQKGSL